MGKANAEDLRMMREWLPTEPHPGTGEPFLEKPFEITQKSGCEPVEYWEYEPERPAREYLDYDDWLVVRTDEEMQALEKCFEATHAEWVKRGSLRGPTMRVVRIRPDEITGTFWTASGACARGVRLPDGSWAWLQWEDKGVLP